MSAVSAANSNQYTDLISAYSDGTSMDYPEAIVDDDEFMSSDEMSIDVEITTLPTELQSLIFDFSTRAESKSEGRQDASVVHAAPAPAESATEPGSAGSLKLEGSRNRTWRTGLRAERCNRATLVQTLTLTCFSWLPRCC